LLDVVIEEELLLKNQNVKKEELDVNADLQKEKLY